MTKLTPLNLTFKWKILEKHEIEANIFHLYIMTKLLINKVFSFIFSSFFAALFLMTDNLLFMSYSIATIIIYFIFDHFLYTKEIQKNVDRILDYIFFYLDEDSQIQLFKRHKIEQIQDLVNLWFLIELYSIKRYKNYNCTKWEKASDRGFLVSKKAKCIQKYLLKNKKKIQNKVNFFHGKQDFINYLMDNLENEAEYQEVFSKIETLLKKDPYFLSNLNNLVQELPKDLSNVKDKDWDMFLAKL